MRETMSLTPWIRGALLAALPCALILQAAHGATPCPAATSAKCTKPPAASALVVAAPSTTEVSSPAVPESWKAVLEPLHAGGWAFISDGPVENPSAVYASTHNVLHDGNVVTAWMRWEFSRPQAEVYPLHYLSAVTREE